MFPYINQVIVRGQDYVSANFWTVKSVWKAFISFEKSQQINILSKMHLSRLPNLLKQPSHRTSEKAVEHVAYSLVIYVKQRLPQKLFP